MPLATALLRHDAPDGVHYDWLLEPPTAADDPQRPLWTARVNLPSTQWRTAQPFALLEIAPHRRAYLTFEGQLTQGRGSVTRVDEGQATAHLWTASRRVIAVSMRHFIGVLELTHPQPLEPAQWQARVLDADGNPASPPPDPHQP